MYLPEFYKEANRCIENGSIVDLVYGLYLITILYISAAKSLEPALVTCFQFCQSLSILERSGKVRQDELLWIETLWLSTVYSINRIHRDLISRSYATNSEDPFVRCHQILMKSQFFLPTDRDVAQLPYSMNTETICQKVMTSSFYMHFYFEYLLFRQSRPEIKSSIAKEIIVKRLRRAVRKIIRLVDHLPNISAYIGDAYDTRSNTSLDDLSNEFLHHPNIRPRGLEEAANPKYRDAALALLYVFARLINKLLEPSVNVDESGKQEICNSAIALCRICATFPSDSYNKAMAPLLVKRSLFWAGLILTTSMYPSGIHLLLYIPDICRASMDRGSTETMHPLRDLWSSFATHRKRLRNHQKPISTI
jgi:hypothetical protein